MPYRIDRAGFEVLVEKAIEGLPRRYMKYFTNISIMVEDYPSPEEADSLGVPRDELLGLFTGVPYPHKGGFFEIPQPMPDAIVLFQRNIEAFCSSEAELIEEIRKTLIHEVGHYFGLSEEELRRYE